MGIYDILIKDIKGKELPFGDVAKGKIAVVVNVASKCGLTPQYKALEKLYTDYKEKDVVVLGFPCNQFMGQEPGSEAQIEEFACSVYKVSFPLFAKIDVNGKNTHPLYAHLKSAKGGYFGQEIGWNFAKFLIDREGNVVERYLPTTDPSAIATDIEKLLK
jgi:glutathione peroxidase